LEYPKVITEKNIPSKILREKIINIISKGHNFWVDVLLVML
jgi:hypothetical protein